MFENPKSSYEELMKSLSAAFTLHIQDMKKYQNNFDEAELFILRNVKANQVQSMYFQTKKIQLDIFKTKISREQSIISRSDSAVQERLEEEQSFKLKSNNLKQEIQKYHEQIESQKTDIRIAKEEKKEMQNKMITLQEELNSRNQELNSIMEENHQFKLEKMQAVAMGSSNNSSENVELILLKEKQEKSSLEAELSQLSNKLSESEKKKKELSLLLLEEQQKVIKQKETIEIQQSKNNENESQILKLKQEKELIVLESMTHSQTKQAGGGDQNLQLIQSKNDQITQLSETSREQQQKLALFQFELAEQKESLQKLRQEKEIYLTEISQLEKQNQQLNDKLKHAEDKGSPEKSTAFNVLTVLKDLEDGKTLLERKNQEILLLKKQARDMEEENYKLREQIEIKQFQQGEQGNQRYGDMNQQDTENNDEMTSQIEESLELLMKDQDSKKIEILKKLKERITNLEKEYMFQVNDSKIKREQLQPYKEKVEVLSINMSKLQKENEELKNQVQNQSLGVRSQSVAQNRPMSEMEKRQSLQERPQIRDNEALDKNNTNCTPCNIF